MLLDYLLLKQKVLVFHPDICSHLPIPVLHRLVWWSSSTRNRLRLEVWRRVELGLGAHVEVIVALEFHHLLIIHVIHSVNLLSLPVSHIGRVLETNAATVVGWESSLRFLSRSKELLGITAIGCDVAPGINHEARL